MTTLFSEISQYFAGNELRFPEKNLIYKENVLINFTFSKNYASFTWVRTLENTFITSM